MAGRDLCSSGRARRRRLLRLLPRRDFHRRRLVRQRQTAVRVLDGADSEQKHVQSALVAKSTLDKSHEATGGVRLVPALPKTAPFRSKSQTVSRHSPVVRKRGVQKTTTVLNDRSTLQHITVPHSTPQYLSAHHSASGHTTVPLSTSRYLTVPDSTSQYLIVPHRTSQHLTALHSIVPHSSHNTSQYLTAHHITPQHTTVPHSTSQHSTVFTAHHSTSQLSQKVKQMWSKLYNVFNFSSDKSDYDFRKSIKVCPIIDTVDTRLWVSLTLSIFLYIGKEPAYCQLIPETV